MENGINVDGGTPGLDQEQDNTTQESGIKREPDQNASQAQKNLVTNWAEKVKKAKVHWGGAFKKMRSDQKFCRGIQWHGQGDVSGYQNEDKTEDRYVVNITLRHVQQRVAALYAKNPKAVARKREMLLNTVWDGTQETLRTSQMKSQATQAIPQVAAQALASGDIGALTQVAQMLVENQQAVQEGQAILEDAENVRSANIQLDKIARTLELLYQYNVDEQSHPFKAMMKLTVRRAVTAGVGYVKLGYQREFGLDPDKEAEIADFTMRIAELKRRQADQADGEISEDHHDVAAIQQQIEALSQEVEIIVRDGLAFDYPTSTSIIPDTNTIQLREFLGAEWVAQEYMMAPNDIKKIYQVDVQGMYTGYSDDGATDDTSDMGAILDGDSSEGSEDEAPDERTMGKGKACVWEVYSKTEGLVFTICEGYPDFLRKPKAPEVYTERFWPWFPLIFNECVDEDQIFPPSDVQLIRNMQLEVNRSREALREHRMAARPGYVAAKGQLSEVDKKRLESHPPHAVVELDAMQPGQTVDQLLQAMPNAPIDPNLYETSSIYDDTLRVTGTQEANLGGTSGATATETNIAESSRMTSLGSNIDDLDDLLTDLAKAGGQVLLMETDEQTVKEAVGPGAVWPDVTRAQVAKDLVLEVEAGSTGRPSREMEIQNAERLIPLMLQIPGLSPEFLLREMLKRLDDRIDPAEALSQNVPSIMALNAANATGGGRPPSGPSTQGPEGAGQGPQGAAGAANTPAPPGG